MFITHWPTRAAIILAATATSAEAAQLGCCSSDWLTSNSAFSGPDCVLLPESKTETQVLFGPRVSTLGSVAKALCLDKRDICRIQFVREKSQSECPQPVHPRFRICTRQSIVTSFTCTVSIHLRSTCRQPIHALAFAYTGLFNLRSTQKHSTRSRIYTHLRIASTRDFAQPRVLSLPFTALYFRANRCDSAQPI